MAKRYCVNCTVELSYIDDDPNGEKNCVCARCRAEEEHDFDAEPDVGFDRYGNIIELDNSIMLQQLRLKWEKGLQLVAEISVDNHKRLVVLKNSNGLYYCHRYFTCGDEWVVSVDMSGVTADEAMRWMFDNRD